MNLHILVLFNPFRQLFYFEYFLLAFLAAP